MGSHISLFSGVGMTDYAAERMGYKTIATAEVDPFCRQVLRERFPQAVHFSDVHDVAPNSVVTGSSGHVGRFGDYVTRPLLISGGFPCQDVSAAGTGKGLAGERSGLWSEFKRVISEFQPEVVLIENSPMLRSRGLVQVLWDLNRLGYNAVWDCVPAAAVGAPHMRDRIWIIAQRRPAVPETGKLSKLTKYGVLSIEGMHQMYAPPKLSRAGRLVNGYVIDVLPVATIKDAKKAILAHAVPCPATPTGAWPTPAASNPQDGESAESWLTRRATLKEKGINGNGAGMPLSIAVKLFPTPTKSDGSGGPGTTPKREGGKNLRTVVAESEGNGRLNPNWVEWMMGLPLGWTNPLVPNSGLVAHPGWNSEAGIPRTVADGLSNRAKRIRALGNGLVPQVAAQALTWVDA